MWATSTTTGRSAPPVAQGCAVEQPDTREGTLRRGCLVAGSRHQRPAWISWDPCYVLPAAGSLRYGLRLRVFWLWCAKGVDVSGSLQKSKAEAESVNGVLQYSLNACVLYRREGILEYYWGEHIHLGYYSAAERAAGYKKKDFKRAKTDFVDEMLRWSGAQAPARVLDVGCGIGGTSRHLAARFPDAQVQGAPAACPRALLGGCGTCPGRRWSRQCWPGVVFPPPPSDGVFLYHPWWIALPILANAWWRLGVPGTRCAVSCS